MRERDWSAQVDVERAVDLLHRERLQPPGAGQRRVGYQDVDLACLGDETVDGGPIAQVNRECARAVERGGERPQHVRAPSCEDQLAAALVQGAGDRLTEAAGGAGEQDGGAGDLH
jgi:hypothetical protein